MKKIFLPILFIITVFPIISFASVNITNLFGYTIGQPLDTSKYHSTSEDIIIKGQKVPIDKSFGDMYQFIPEKNDFNISFDEYNLISDPTDTKLSGIIVVKNFNNDQNKCQEELKKVATIMVVKFGRPDFIKDNVVSFTDSKNTFKVAGVICSLGNLSITVTDNKLFEK